MSLQQKFQIAGGTIIGKDHVAIGKNNQDGLFITERYNRTLCSIVCDGCGSQPNSEVGAKLFASLLGTSIVRHLDRYPDHGFLAQAEQTDIFLKRIKDDVLAYMRMMIINLGDSMSRVVNDMFLFTVVGAVITEKVSIFFSLGDGVIYINGERIPIGPWSNNEPPYLAYNLVKSTLGDTSPHLLNFQVHGVMATQELNHALIGSDGLTYLEAAAEKTFPGKPTIKVGPVSQLWEEKRFFSNPFAVQRFLNMVNMTHTQIDWIGQRVEKENGHLCDDTTLAVIRRNTIEQQD